MLFREHWQIPDLAGAFATCTGATLLYYDDNSLKEKGVMAKSTRALIINDLKTFAKLGVPLEVSRYLRFCFGEEEPPNPA